MWKAAQRGWIPPTKLINQETFLKLKHTKTSSAEKGYIGHFYSYMGKYFVPFDNSHTPKQAREQSDKIVQIAHAVKNVMFTTGSYEIMAKLKNFVIYCDSPYEERSQYYGENGIPRQKLDFHKFWDWCRNMSQFNLVFISAYSAPKDFNEVFKMSSRTTRTTRTERLFIYSLSHR